MLSTGETVFGRVNRADKACIHEINTHRRQKDHFFAVASQSHLLYEQRHERFSGLNYFPPDPAFRVVAEVTSFERPEVVQMATSTGEIRLQERSAELRFRIGDHELRLVGFTDPHQHHTHELFAPFRDASSGHETYSAGRYLEVELERRKDGTYLALIDFNLAYNPYCAYSPNFSCPIPPAENRLPVAIPVGERSYRPDH
jgi:uncharacterized protein (DUF1684 family)